MGVMQRDFVVALTDAVAARPCDLRAQPTMTGRRPMWRGPAWLAALKDLDQLPPADAMPTVDLDIRFEDGKLDVSQASLPALDATKPKGD